MIPLFSPSVWWVNMFLPVYATKQTTSVRFTRSPIHDPTVFTECLVGEHVLAGICNETNHLCEVHQITYS